MKYLITILGLLSLFSCKNKPIQKQEEAKQQTSVWEKMDFKPEKGLILPSAYTCYRLNIEEFSKALVKGELDLPMPSGEFHLHKLEDSGTMSPELQAKFPNIRSMKGIDQRNNLCQSRLDQKDSEVKIVIFCNDATIYIQELHDTGLHFVYYKKDLPEGVGTVNE